MFPVVSVITPTHHAAAFVARCIASVQGQTFTDWEHVVVDDGSTDDTADVVARHADGRLRLLRLPNNQGAAVSRNRGIEAARGRYIAFLDADDRWLPDKLACQLELMRRHGAALAHASYVHIDVRTQRRVVIPCKPRVTYADALAYNPIGCLTAIYDRERLGLRWFPNRRTRQDYALWLSILREGTTSYGDTRILAEYHARPGSLSSRKWRAARQHWSVLRGENLPLTDTTAHFARYAARGLARAAILATPVPPQVREASSPAPPPGPHTVG